ncbi:ABC transporter ATP-binding protein [Clostridiales bacterium FE2011]|nr:ABC transporter ATP-binding protein [Clostridiales bacterium FE2011]
MTGKPKNAGQTIRRLLGYVGKYWYKLVLVLLCMLVTTVTSLCGGYLMAPIVDHLALAVNPDTVITMSPIEKIADGILSKITAGEMVQNWIASGTIQAVSAYVAVALIVLAIIYLVGVCTTYLQARLMMSVSLKVIETIRNDLFRKMQSLPVRYYDGHPTGELMSRYTNDIDNIDTMINNSLVGLVSGLITLIGTFIFMITTSWILTLITILFIPVFLFGGMTIAKKSAKYYAWQQAALGAVNGYIEETVTGAKVIKVFNHESECEEEFSLLNGDLKDKQFGAQFWGGIMWPVMGNVGQVTYAVTIGVGGILMCTGGFTPGALTVFAGYSRQFSMPINQMSQQATTILAALAGAERVFAVMDAEPEVPDREGVEETEIRGDVVVEHVTFGYVPDKIVLKDISLYAHPGQKIAFVGSTGAGKTTVTNLLNRFYDIEEGIITIDGKDIKDYPREWLRKNIAMVLQDTHLFTGTVRENIRYGRLDATDEEVEAAAKLASAHSFIMRLEHGYDTMLEGDGANLSQGQRQLLNIARAAVSKAPILVLDEATSSVDTRTERHIEHGMDRLMKNRTTFVIAHRLSTVRNANAIMVLEKGEIIERGTHDDLLEMKGRYYELYTGKKELD